MNRVVCKISRTHKRKTVYAGRLLALLTLAACGFLVGGISLSANNDFMHSEYPKVNPTPTSDLQNRIPPQIPAQRIRVAPGETKEVTVAAGADSFVVTAPEVLTAEIKDRFRLSVTGVKTGEAVLIVFSGARRHTIVIEITKRLPVSERNLAGEKIGPESTTGRTYGSYTALYTHSSDGGPSALRQALSMNSKVSAEGTLRISAETSKILGSKHESSGLAAIEDFGLNRLSAGLETPDRTIEFLDNNLNISALTFNNYTMRGFHLTSRGKTASNTTLPAKELEVFAGLARPTLAFFDRDQGRVAGAIVPVTSGDNWKIRAGFVSISSEKNLRTNNGGNVALVEGVYAPNKNLVIDGEAEIANASVSWRARADFKSEKYGAFGEIRRLASNSPFNSIGAQPGGTQTETAGGYWRPVSRFSLSANYNHSEIERLYNSSLSSFDRTGFTAALGYRIGKGSRLNFRFSRQKIETAFGAGASKLNIDTRNATLGYSVRFNSNWSNMLDGRFIISREAGSAAGLESGFSISEQLRFSPHRYSVTGFLNYNNRTPSLTGLLVRNPQLLPPSLQQAFIIDPTLFLQTYRDRMSTLLFGVELPQTRSLDAGLRFQTRISRFTLTGESRYTAGEIFSANQKNIYGSLSVDMRLDNANSIRVSGWTRTGGSNNRSALTFSYTHIFGQGGEGFQFSKLLGLDRGRVEGRVYYDLNGNGQADADEPGVGGILIRIGENRTVRTDSSGRYGFLADRGGHNVEIVSDYLGGRLKASTVTRQLVSISPRKTINLNFGVMDSGFISGRVFNDLDLSGKAPNSASLGLAGVSVILRSTDGTFKPRESQTGPGGVYEFPNIRPGKYTVEIDPKTLPVNFRIPEQTRWEIIINPLQGYYLDIPITAQRAVAGVVYIDNDGDNRYDPAHDTPIKGARVTSGADKTFSDNAGAYMLRNLAAGKISLVARLPDGRESAAAALELGAEPVTARAINLAVRR